MAAMELNCKGQLCSYCATNKKSPPKFINDSEGPPHNPRFTCKVSIDDILVGQGEGKTKKEAENKASKAALEFLGHQETGIQQGFDALLNEFCQKKGWIFSFVESDRIGQSHIPEFTCKAKVNEIMYPESGRKKKKKLAIKEAAYLALRELRKEFPNDIPKLPDDFIDDSGSENCSLSGSSADPGLDRSRGENGLLQTAAAPPNESLLHNYISILNEICQKKRWIFSFLDESADNNQFTCKASIDKKTYPRSNPRRTKQLAKKEAAFIALRQLKKEYPTEIPTLPDVYTDEFMNEDSTVSRQSGNLPGQGLHSTSSSSVAENLPDPLKDFEDVTDLNSGRFGKVMKAKKKLDDMYYAVKRVQVQSKDIKRYAEEVKILAHLLHPNIIRYYHSWLADDYVPISDSSESSISASDQGKKIEKCLFIQMELCEMDLKKWIKQRNATKNVDKNQSLRLFKQIVEAVRYIHSEKLIHRDLKPANIFFTKDVVKIGDFGLVAHMSGEDGVCQRTQGTGTPSYMAPEQKEGNKYENEVDIYALGLILFELLWIFTFGTLHEKAIEWAKIRNASLPSDFVRCYPIEECEIKKMLSKEPKKRPSATQLKQFFEAIDILDSRTC